MNEIFKRFLILKNVLVNICFLCLSFSLDTILINLCDSYQLLQGNKENKMNSFIAKKTTNINVCYIYLSD